VLLKDVEIIVRAFAHFFWLNRSSLVTHSCPIVTAGWAHRGSGQYSSETTPPTLIDPPLTQRANSVFRMAPG
jgi:hypothetical protein